MNSELFAAEGNEFVA